MTMRMMSPPSSPAASTSSRTATNTNTPISPTNLTSQLLARLDTPSYATAILADAASLLHNFLLPHNFPWARFRRYYDKEVVPPSTDTFVGKELPFDIDELDAICYYDGK
mmetsp:Transcript_12445/g.19172  ORF Transcript_12445/g.19172 Transcript_12445/m.19172 type:complete len:110 (+) Transcript_12445:27-356(+)